MQRERRINQTGRTTDSKERRGQAAVGTMCVQQKSARGKKKTCDKGKKYNKGNGSTFGEIHLFLLYFSPQKKNIPLKTKFSVRTLTEQNKVAAQLP